MDALRLGPDERHADEPRSEQASPLIFRKGLDLKHAVAGSLTADYHSELIEQVKKQGFELEAPGLKLYLAKEFGFCYGVDRAVDYAYQARHKFPDRNVYLTGEIIHNPRVNDRLRELGVKFLSDAGESVERVGPKDVVILPAFGVPMTVLAELERRGCTLVDTTCGSVLNVWKTVKRYAQDRFTSVIHGKVHHEETQATASHALQHGDSAYLVVLNREEAAEVCRYITDGGDRRQFLEHFAQAASAGFDPDVDLQRVGLANQTTMLMSESLAIGEQFREAMLARYGEAALGEHFRSFETICSATQDRQDAVVELLDGQTLDLMIVIGGYNSSNTGNLARICAARLTTYHIADADRLLTPREIRHHPVAAHEEVVTCDWLPANRPVRIGVTAGASTPDVIVGAVIAKLREFTAPGA